MRKAEMAGNTLTPIYKAHYILFISFPFMSPIFLPCIMKHFKPKIMKQEQNNKNQAGQLSNSCIRVRLTKC